MANTTKSELELALTHLTRAGELAMFYHHSAHLNERIKLAKRLVTDIQHEIEHPESMEQNNEH